MLITGNYKNLLFLFIIVTNTGIGIFQEIRAKRTLDKLSLLTAPRAVAVRDGQECVINTEDIVLDDTLLLTPGKQVPADGYVISSESCDVDESLLTGESDTVSKSEGDQMMSGSFVVSGRLFMKVTAVGDDSFAAKIAHESRKYKKVRSELRDALNWILKLVSFIIFPMGAALFATQLLLSHQIWQDAILTATAGMLGMIPEGLLLLTSVALALGVIRLAHKRTLCQSLNGIETLARVNVLCLDKTGTLTEGVLSVEHVDLLGCRDHTELCALLSTFTSAFPDANASARAIQAHSDHAGKHSWPVKRAVPFSPVYKWSGVDFEGQGTYVLGAPEIVGRDVPVTVRQDGSRSLLFMKSASGFGEDAALPPDLEPLAVIYIRDTVRKTAPETLGYFYSQDVDIKIISGDNAMTASIIAAEAGIRNADKYISASDLPEDEGKLRELVKTCTVFGRVTPYDKKRLIAAIQDNGNVVAMTGDGVNDVLALKQSDCGIAMASGSEAARGVAQIVLLDSDFSTLPDVVFEGRRVINNIERVACMYLIKTIYSFLLTLIFIFYPRPFPFEPIHHTLIGAITVGIPSFFLAMEANRNRVTPGFIKKVLIAALPAALTVTVTIMAANLLITFFTDDIEQLKCICPVLTGVVGLITLFRVSRPLTMLRCALLASMIIAFVAAIVYFGPFFSIPDLQFYPGLLFSGLALLTYPLILLFSRLTRSFLESIHLDR